MPAPRIAIPGLILGEFELDVMAEESMFVMNFFSNFEYKV